MRNKDRIRPFCERLAAAWEKCPDMRFGQFICNVYTTELKHDPFYIEDEESMRLIEKCANECSPYHKPPKEDEGGMSMGVYINMEMPKEGFVEILIRDDGTVQQTGQSYRIDGTDYYEPYVGEMPKMFTAIPVPPHGDLIDRAELVDSFDPSDFWNPSAEDNCFAAIHVVNSMPTIIPASKEGET